MSGKKNIAYKGNDGSFPLRYDILKLFTRDASINMLKIPDSYKASLYMYEGSLLSLRKNDIVALLEDI